MRGNIAMATVCAKLEHAFHSAIETYYRVKRGVTQIVRVERVEVLHAANECNSAVRHTLNQTPNSSERYSHLAISRAATVGGSLKLETVAVAIAIFANPREASFGSLEMAHQESSVANGAPDRAPRTSCHHLE